MITQSEQACLIVNADDYGYFDCVSRGILAASENGIVTATGIFANSPQFDRHVDWLKNDKALDLGVHLNLTNQAPLTSDMRSRLSRWSGKFPGKYPIAKAMLSGTISAELVRQEWRAQIERCLEKNLEIRFLNSHEHIHMLPPLFSVIGTLAEEFHIPHIRFPTSELFWDWGLGAIVRDSLIKTVGLINHRQLKRPAALFLGMGESGRLSLRYLEKRLPELKPGQVYELMCHPGYYDNDEIRDPRLKQYHDWRGEFDTLNNSRIREILRRHNIRLVGYRHLAVQSNRLIARIVPE